MAFGTIMTQLTEEFGYPVTLDSTTELQLALEVVMGKDAAAKAKEAMDDPNQESTGAEPADPTESIEDQAQAWAAVINAIVTTAVQIHKDSSH